MISVVVQGCQSASMRRALDNRARAGSRAGGSRGAPGKASAGVRSELLQEK